MPKIFVRDIEIHYREEGTGFPLILIHGLNGDLTGWGLVMPEFARYFRTLALDLRGHGDSGKPDQPYSIKEFSEDLKVFLTKLQIPQTHLLGLSMGGAIAKQFAI
ncbi:MAG: alpha/beta fold hydrolase, partial [Deltaproteobacteria bacterium]|nr:alpha/beta fold hydrolase [Deltaproteobacteria bacterium]